MATRLKWFTRASFADAVESAERALRIATESQKVVRNILDWRTHRHPVVRKNTVLITGARNHAVLSRILDVKEIRPCRTRSNQPFDERMRARVRRECLDRTLFWTAADLGIR
jgi:hypothetical protein